jgi:predicted  nucleic acid-binding Zn-ribbon protein
MGKTYKSFADLKLSLARQQQDSRVPVQPRDEPAGAPEAKPVAVPAQTSEGARDRRPVQQSVAPSGNASDPGVVAIPAAPAEPPNRTAIPLRVPVSAAVLEERIRAVEKREDKATEQEAWIREQVRRIPALNAEIQSLLKQRTGLSREVGDLRARQARIARTEAILQEKKQRMAARYFEIQRESKAVEAKAREHTRRTALLDERERSAAKRELACKQIESEGARVRADLGAAKSQMAALTRDLGGLQPAEIRRKFTRLEATVEAAERDRDEAQQSLARLVGTVESVEAEAENLRPLAEAGLLLTSRSIRNWLVKGFNPDKLGHPHCVTIGAGPFDSDEFDGFLRRHGYEVYHPGFDDIDIMVVGRQEWSEEALERQLEAREGTTLRVYSQEMFIAAMAAWRDPFDTANEKTILAFGRGHPALEYLRDSALEWPGTQPSFDHLGEFTGDGSSQESPLHSMGYVVGITYGLPATERREILEEAFNGELHWVTSDEYMEGWGRPRTRRRLWRMANHIAHLVRLRQGIPNLDVAVGHWKSDLAWMKRTLYRPSMRFAWPGTEVG